MLFSLIEFIKEVCQLLQMQKKQVTLKVKDIKSYKSQNICHFS